ncbi:NLR family CARD domain-containing protein 4-like [Anneissia japonica]|uniref:NLR family CARD domain-containing protein 4-like n=1 Tax=Anneissia japonica TaxID=1529436 RepID=UPI0014259190|nr:NLR family CARD domain-containing protein 4-like [Anneissia japonica]
MFIPHENEKRKDDIIRKYLLGRLKLIFSKANRFTPATWNSRYEVDIAHMFTDLDILNENKDNKVEKPTIQEVLGIIKSTPACRVVIDGEGGIGKSTLLRFLAYNWANDLDETFKGKLLFLVKVRDINKCVVNEMLKVVNVDEFESLTNLKPGYDLIKQFIVKHAHEIILLLDGLDELKDHTKSPISLFKKEQLNNSKVIVTSRSGTVGLDNFVKESDIHVNVKGFNERNIERYIKRYFKYCKKPVLAETLISKLILDESRRKDSKHMDPVLICKNPMLLLSVCAIWEDKQYLPTDKSELFKEVYRCIINMYIDKHEALQMRKISIFENIPPKYIYAMLVLGNCMYESLKKNKLSINKANMEGNKEGVELALKLGFVYKDAPIYKDDFEEIFTPPHKLIVESLVGFYISNQCKTQIHQLKPLENNEWDVIRMNEHLEVARMFAIDFLEAKAGKFLKHWITNSLSIFSLMTHLNHVKEEHRVHVEKTITDYISEHSFEMKPHILDICNSLCRCIHYIDPTVNENWTFLRLTRKAQHVQNQIVNLLKKSRFLKMSPELLGKMIAHLLIVLKDQNVLFKDNVHLRDDHVVNFLLNEFQKLRFQYDISDLINNSLHPSLLTHILFQAPNISFLNLNKCHVTGDKINEYFMQCPKSGMLKLKCLDISNNNLSAVKGASLAGLLTMSPNLNGLNMTKCMLSGVVVNDMVRICSSRVVVLNLEEIYISNNDMSSVKGSSLSGLFVLAPNLNYIDMQSCSLSGVAVNDMVRHLSNNRVKMILLEKLKICGNNLNEIEGASLAGLLVICPVLSELQLNNCSLSGSVFNDMIKMCISKKVMLELTHLDASNNDLSAIEGALLAELLAMAPNVYMIDINSSSVSGTVVNNMVEICSKKKVVLKLQHLNISYNNLSAIGGASLARLLVLAPNLNYFDVQNCGIEGVVVNDLVENCSREVVLKLEYLNLSDNNLSAIKGNLLGDLLVMAPNLCTIGIKNSSLSGAVVNDMVRIRFKKDGLLKLEELDISDNNLGAIEGASLARLLFMAPNLRDIYINSCSLSGAVVNHMIKILPSMRVVLDLILLDISNNDLSAIKGDLLADLLAMVPNLRTININNSNLSGAVVNYMVEICSKKEVVLLKLENLNISYNTLSAIKGASLAGLLVLAPNLNYFDVHRCTLKSVAVNDMVGVCSGKRVQFKLEYLNISNNNLCAIEGAVLADLVMMCPKLSKLEMSKCSLTGGVMNDMVSVCVSKGVMLGLIYLDISNNDLSSIESATLSGLYALARDLRTIKIDNYCKIELENTCNAAVHNLLKTI